MALTENRRVKSSQSTENLSKLSPVNMNDFLNWDFNLVGNWLVHVNNLRIFSL